MSDSTIEHIHGLGLRYAPYYCEENIWHLCEEPRLAGHDKRVVFISNPDRTCALWGQRAASDPAGPVVWDYHVILLARADRDWQVWDLDTLFGLPVPAVTWLSRTFVPLRDEYRQLAPAFRLIEAQAYRAQFSSDRSHMKTSAGDWQQPPPDWPAIVQPGAPSFLRWSEIAATDRDVMSLPDLYALVRAA